MRALGVPFFSHSLTREWEDLNEILPIWKQMLSHYFLFAFLFSWVRLSSLSYVWRPFVFLFYMYLPIFLLLFPLFLGIPCISLYLDFLFCSIDLFICHFHTFTSQGFVKYALISIRDVVSVLFFCSFSGNNWLFSNMIFRFSQSSSWREKKVDIFIEFV